MHKTPTAKILLDLVQRQASASHALTDCTTFRDMAGAIAQHMLVEGGQFIALNLLEDGEDSTHLRLLTLATANREQTYNSVEVIEIVPEDLGVVLSEAAPNLVEDVETHEAYSPIFRDWLLNHKVRALAAWPMRHGEQIFGVLCLSSLTSGLELSPVVLQLYQVVTDQIAALIWANHMTGEAAQPNGSSQPESDAAQELSTQLAQTNREIAAAENYEALANVLMQVMPEAVTALAIALFDRPVQTDERPSTLESKVIVSRNGATDLQVVDQIAPHPELANTLKSLTAGEIVVLSKSANPILPPITLSLLQAQGLSSISLIGLRSGLRLSGLLILGSDHTLSLNKFLQNNYRSLADQVAISIENRGLLGQTAETLSFVQAQFEATSAVYDSANPQEMLQAVYRFTGGQFKHGHLGLIDRDNAPMVVRIMADAHFDQISTNPHEVALESYPAFESLPALETLYVPDVANDSFLTEAERSRLHSQDIGGLVIVPMVVNQQLTGLIAFMSPVATTVSPNRLRALRNLADQAAVAFENQSLLASTAATLDETRLLYDVNRSILAAQDTMDVLRVMRQLLATEASSINHMTAVYDYSTGQMQDIRTDFISLIDGTEQVNDLSLVSVIGADKIAAFQPFWQGRPGTVYFVEDMDTVEADYPLAQYALDNGDYSSITILIRENNQVAELVNVAFSHPQKFATSQRRLYEAISDQVAIVFQNHRLLRESQISASQLSKQVQKLQRINQFGTMINAASDEKSLLDSATELVVKLVEVDHSGIVLVNPGDDFGVVVSEYPLHGSLGAKIATTNNPLWDELKVNGEFRPMVVSDVKSDPRVEPLTRKAFSDLGLHSIAILPIVVHNELIGGVGLDIYTPNRPVTAEMIENAQIVTAQINLAVQNVRLVRDIQASADQLKNQVQVLQSLNQMASHINVTMNEQELADNTVRMLPELLGIDHCGLVLLDAEKTSGTVIGEYPLTGAVGQQIDVGADSLYDYIHSKDLRPMVVDVENDPRLGASSRAVLRGIGTKTLAIVPLIVAGDVIGSLGLDIYTEGRTFTPQVVEIAQTVASQLAIGLQNIRLLNTTRHRAEQLQRIASFGQSVQATFDPAVIFDNLLTESAQMLPIDQIAIMRYDTERQELRTVAERVDTTNHIQLVDGELVPISGPIAQVWSTREPLHIPDLRKMGQPISPSLTVRSWMVAPILSRGRVIGLVSAGSNHPSAYEAADIALFSQMINQLALAIENAEAYQQSQRTAKNESLVNDISTQLQRQMDIRSMLDITANELGKVLGARRARIRLATHVPDDGEVES